MDTNLMDINQQLENTTIEGSKKGHGTEENEDFVPWMLVKNTIRKRSPKQVVGQGNNGSTTTSGPKGETKAANKDPANKGKEDRVKELNIQAG